MSIQSSDFQFSSINISSLDIQLYFFYQCLFWTTKQVVRNKLCLTNFFLCLKIKTYSSPLKEFWIFQRILSFQSILPFSLLKSILPRHLSIKIRKILIEVFIKKTTSEWLKRFLLIFTELVPLAFTTLRSLLLPRSKNSFVFSAKFDSPSKFFYFPFISSLLL